jgi:phage-related protein
MANWISFRGVSTASMTGVIVAKMPSHKKAQMRYTEYMVKGRDGVLHTDDGFDTVDLTCRLLLQNQPSTHRQLIDAWADGTGRLITSDDSTRAYIASVLREIQWTRDEGNNGFWDTAEITFTCQPIMREAVESTSTFTSSGSIINLGNVDALPLIKVTGSGTCVFSVAGTEVTLTNVASNKPVFIDCENGYVYTESGAATMQGEFPVIPVSSTAQAVTLTSGVTKLEITPRWGWV